MAQSPHLLRLRKLWLQDIWTAGLNRERTAKNRFFALLRIASITLSGLHELKVAPRAAALSYSSLLSLGPLIALAVLISGFALGNQDPAILAQSVNRIIGVIAPQVGQFDRASERPVSPANATVGTAGSTPENNPARPPSADPELVKLINNFIAHSRSGTAGAIGLLALLVIVIQLFSSIENTFNDIWGVRRGRGWLTRIVYYWSAISLGAVLFFASLTLFSAGAFMHLFIAKIPLGSQLARLIAWMLPSLSGVLLVTILMLFYRIVPNTRVRWQAALIGALVVATLLFLNNYFAFLYFRQVYLQQTLYGSVGILPVLMLGLYVFWFFLLVGGQITYAVQNVHYRSSQTAWHSLNHVTRESMSLLVLLLIARRFKSCQPAYSVTELSHLVRIPAQILNESLNRLCDLQLIAEFPPGEGADPNDHRYQPARPLAKITLGNFRQLFEDYGESPSGGLLDNVDPVLAYYHERLTSSLPQALGERNLDQLLDEQPQASETGAAFAIPPPAG